MSRSTHRVVIALVIVAIGIPLNSGCQSDSNWLKPLWPRVADRGKPTADRADAKNDDKSAGPLKPMATSAKGTAANPFQILADDGWIQAIAAPDSKDPPRHHWRHRALDDLLDRPRAKQPDWQAAMHSDKSLVATNAAIALSRLGEGHPEEALADGVRSTELKLATRRAAAEALGDVQSPQSLAKLRELIDEYGQFAGEHRSRYVPDLHGELLRSLGHQSQAGSDQRIFDALKSPAPVVKREALEAIANQQNITASALPPLVLDMTTDGDTQVRIAALRLLANKQHPQTYDKLQHALSDYELSVRLTAIELLGQTGAQEAQGRLKQLSGDHAELIREAAIKSLAKLGNRDDVEGAASDRSWRVRRAVAASLAKYPDRRSSILAQQFLGDLSLEVQLETVHMVATWPLEKAGPLLLMALEGPTYQTRKDATAQLADRWPAAVGFPIDAPPERRAELVAQLQSKWAAQFGNIDQAALAAAAVKPTEIPLARRRQVARWIEDLTDPNAPQLQQTAALESLSALGPELPAVLEALVADQNVKLPPRLYHEVLVRCGKEFELVDQLTDSNLTIRRAAIAELAKLSQQKSISLLAMMRIEELLAAEKDPIAWISIFKLIEHDPRQPAVLLASAGMSHPSPEVRRRACGYFGTYPDPAKIELLMSALADDNLSVLHAAAQALGEFAPPADPAPLENLLAAADHSVRLDAAISLARWNAASGTAALERLAVDDDPAIRRKTAQAIGKLGNSALLPVLIRQLDDEQDIRRAALISLQSLTGSENPPGDNGARPAAYDAPLENAKNTSGEAAPTTLLEQAQRWKQWYARQNR